MNQRPSTITGTPRLLAIALLALALLAMPARALAVGIVPPANPTSDCDRSGDTNTVWSAATIDTCRAAEGIGPLELPSNWTSLNSVQQGFVLIDLERVNRGLAPIAGLSASLDADAGRGAAAQTDPPFPSAGEGGGIWAGGGSVFGADMMWLYDDGPGGFDANEDCISNSSYCWGHRDIILGADGGGTLVAGGGYSGSGGYGSFAYLIMSHYETSDLTFTWSGELHYFSTTPQAEPLGSAAASGAQGASSGSSSSAGSPSKSSGSGSTGGSGSGSTAGSGSSQTATSTTAQKHRHHHKHRKTTITIKFI